MGKRESKKFPTRDSSNVNTRFISRESAQKFADQAREQARLKEIFGRNPTGLETLRFNNPTFEKILTTMGVSPLFIGNQTRMIDGRPTPVPVRSRADGGRLAPPPMPRPRPTPIGLAATPEGASLIYGEEETIESPFKNNVNYFMDTVAQIESTGNPIAANKNTTARGLYQFMAGDYEKGKQGSIETALNRLKSIYGRTRLPPYAMKLQEALNKDKKLKRKRGDASPAVEEVLLKMSPADSRDMFLGNMLQQDVGNKFIKKIGQGDKEAMLEAYLKFHHRGNKNTEEYKKARARAKELLGIA